MLRGFSSNAHLHLLDELEGAREARLFHRNDGMAFYYEDLIEFFTVAKDCCNALLDSVKREVREEEEEVAGL